MTRACAIALLALVAACAGTQVRAHTRDTDKLIETARTNGARRCAPVELATAEVSNLRAQHELDEGNYADAKKAALLADINAHAAIDKSPIDQCADRSAPIAVAKDGDADGDGIPDSVDKCPHDPEDKDNFQDEDGCPDLDNDNDGIPDAVDKCPNDPEDKDGFQDQDGCPDLDNDNDGFADAIDKCPNEAEDKDGFEDDDGCPDPDNDKDGILDAADKCPNEAGPAPDGCPKKYNLVTVTETKIELKQTVYFDTNLATIKSVSFKLLDEVAQALIDNPKLVVEVQGHTDSQGDDDFNMKLSQRRAESVRDYLVKKKVPTERMTPKGYGEEVPIADNRTTDGRSQNRRVEFIITSR